MTFYKMLTPLTERVGKDTMDAFLDLHLTITERDGLFFLSRLDGTPFPCDGPFDSGVTALSFALHSDMTSAHYGDLCAFVDEDQPIADSADIAADIAREVEDGLGIVPVNPDFLAWIEQRGFIYEFCTGVICGEIATTDSGRTL